MNCLVAVNADIVKCISGITIDDTLLIQSLYSVCKSRIGQAVFRRIALNQQLCGLSASYYT